MKFSRRSMLALIATGAASLTYTVGLRPRPQLVRHILPTVTATSLSLSVSLAKSTR